MKKTILTTAFLLLTSLQPVYADMAGAATAVGEELERQAGEDPVKGLIWWIANTFGPNIPTEAQTDSAEDCDDKCFDNLAGIIQSAKVVKQCAALVSNENIVYAGTLVGNPGKAIVNTTVSVWDDTDLVHFQSESEGIPAKSYLTYELKDVQVTSYMVLVTSDSAAPIVASLKVVDDEGETTQPMDCYNIVKLK